MMFSKRPRRSADYTRCRAEEPELDRVLDDGKVFLFGLAHKSTDDLAYIRENQLDADTHVYQGKGDVPSITAPPTPVSWLDQWFRSRGPVDVRPARAGRRPLDRHPLGDPSTSRPVHCLAAIREARLALVHNPDEPSGYRILDIAYRFLTLSEAAILAKEPGGGQASDFMLLRYRQRVTALNYAIATTPPPITDPERKALGELYLELAELYRGVNSLDLEHKQLEAASKLLGSEEFGPELHDRLGQLGEAIEQVQNKVEEAANQNASLMQQADLCISYGMPGLAISKLADAEEQGVSAVSVRYRLVDLYCQTGQPEEALKEVSNIEDPALNTGPGTPSHRQGMFSFLLGNYENTSSRASVLIPPAPDGRDRPVAPGRWWPLPRRREARHRRLPGAAVPDRRAGDLGIRAGLLPARVGPPKEAAVHFQRALDLRPDLPILAPLKYYINKIGAASPMPRRPIRLVPPKRSPRPTPTPRASLRRKRRSPRTFGSRPTIASLGLTAFGVRLEHSSSPEYC